MKDSIRALSLVFAVLPAVVILMLPRGAAPEAPAGSVTATPSGSVTATPSGSVHPLPTGSVTASITVSTTMRAGATVSGTITVDNHSGKPIQVLGCGSVYRVLLAGARNHHPSPSWPLCAREITIPTGESRYPVDVAATFHECSPHGAKGLRACERDGSMPRLPAGRYEATATGVSPDLPVPASVSITVTP